MRIPKARTCTFLVSTLEATNPRSYIVYMADSLIDGFMLELHLEQAKINLLRDSRRHSMPSLGYVRSRYRRGTDVVVMSIQP